MTRRQVTRIPANLQEQESFDHHRNLLLLMPTMVGAARQAAQKEAHSYRGFIVGDALYAYEPDTNEFAIIVTGNLKRNKEKKKFCSEMRGTSRAIKAELTHAIGYVTVGTTDADLIAGVNGHRTATLLPCRPCIEYIDESSLIVPDHTLMITAGLDVDRFQANMFAEVRDRYALEASGVEDLPDSPVGFGFDNWDVRVKNYDNLIASTANPSDETRAGFVRTVLIGGTALRAA